MAYFDNAATTYPKPESVYAEMDSFYRNCGGSVGRGEYDRAKTAGQVIAETRNEIKTLLHCPGKQVIFTPSATMALNMIIQGVVKEKKLNVYISPFEHNAVTRVLHHLEKIDAARVIELCVTDKLEYDYERIKYQFDENKPDVVIVSHASNVIGLIAPVEKIFVLAKQYDATTIVDMAQTAGLVDLNVGLSTIDFAVFAGHKTLYGPTGISGFVMSSGYDLKPVLFGGTGYDSANPDMPDSLPERFEMGTLNISGIAGLHAALEWNAEVGMESIRIKEEENRNRLLNILSQYSFVQIVGNQPKQKYVGIISCLFDGISSESVGTILNKQNIAVRTGLQCAPYAHRFLGTFPAGTVRFSVSSFTSEEDFSELVNAMDYLEDNM